MLRVLVCFAATLALAAADNQVSITVNGVRVITSNGIPDHEPGVFPNRGNPHAMTAQSHRYQVSIRPVALPRSIPFTLGAFGVAINGVPFDPGAAEWYQRDPSSGWTYEAIVGNTRKLGIDQHNAHVQPTGAYHYHGIPEGLVAKLGGGPGRMTLVGWGADGFPVYCRYGHRDGDDAASEVVALRSSYQLRKGRRSGGPGGAFDGTFTQDWAYVAGSGDLDDCNGRNGVTPEFPEGTYYYVLTDTFPSIPRRWRGTPDVSFTMRGPGVGGRQGGMGGGHPGGRRPPPPRR